MPAEDHQYVGFWPRVGASIIDSVLVMLVTAPLIHWIYGAEQDVDAYGILAELSAGNLRDLLADLARPQGLLDVLINWVLPAVAVIVFWLTREATPGKMVFGARVVDATTGKAMSVRQGIVRYLGYYVSIFPLFIGLLWVAFDSRKQGFHDKLAGTVVVRAKKKAIYSPAR